MKTLPGKARVVIKELKRAGVSISPANGAEKKKRYLHCGFSKFCKIKGKEEERNK